MAGAMKSLVVGASTSLLVIVGCGGTGTLTDTDGTTNLVMPVLRIVEAGPDSTLLSISNPSDQFSTHEYALCPLDTQVREGGTWRHNGYLMPAGPGQGSADYCPAVAFSILPGGESRFWVHLSLPFDGHSLRLGVQAGDLAVPTSDATWVYSDPIAPIE
jgi:hypothetical protein